MGESTQIFGLSAAIATPFLPNARVDTVKLVKHARHLLDRGCNSVTLFGTTGEGASIGIDERAAVLEAFSEAGFDMRREVAVGILSTNAADAARMGKEALGFNVRGLLLAPPFYYKGVSDDGLYDWFAQVFDGIGNALRDVILYHIPSVTSVPLSTDLIDRLVRLNPGAVIGVKDSSGDWAYTKVLLEKYKSLQILVGDERHLADAMRAGATGSISGLANIAPERLAALIRSGIADGKLSELVEQVVAGPVVPGVKSLIAQDTGDESWRYPRAPLSVIEEDAHRRLVEALFNFGPSCAA